MTSGLKLIYQFGLYIQEEDLTDLGEVFQDESNMAALLLYKNGRTDEYQMVSHILELMHLSSFQASFLFVGHRFKHIIEVLLRMLARICTVALHSVSDIVLSYLLAATCSQILNQIQITIKTMQGQSV